MEGDETVTLILDASEDCVPDTPDAATITIVDAPAPVITLSPSTAEVAEGGSVDITITRSGNTSGALVVSYTLDYGSATLNDDYTVTPSDYIYFADGQSTATLSIDTIDDSFPDPNETVDIQLAVSSNYVLGNPSAAEITITDDDQYQLLTLPPRSPGDGMQVSIVNADQIARLMAAAGMEWIAAGASPVAVYGEIAQADVRIADLGGSVLAATNGNTIWLDRDAAGYGWFIDQTPRGGSEFRIRVADGELMASGSSPAFGRVDALTVIAHEVGHLLGLADQPPELAVHDIMNETIGLSTRRSPVRGLDVPSIAQDAPEATASDHIFGDKSHPLWLSNRVEVDTVANAVARTSRPRLHWGDFEN